MANERASEGSKVNYSSFLETKAQVGGMSGFDPVFMPEFLFDFQRAIVEWAVRKGRAAVLADCGLGKTPMQLVWAENVVRHTNRPVLILTPIAVGQQTIHEAEKFGIEAVRSNDGTVPTGSRIVVSNYEKLHKFNTDDFAGVVCDESSILKNIDGTTRDAVIEFMRTRPYRLLCTATAAPNDYVELGNASESLGEMGFQDMVTRFFKQETSKDYLGWGRTKYRLRGHAERDFWRWVCSWARAIRRPSDMGFDDSRFVLPTLTTNEHLVAAKVAKRGMLFDLPGVTLQDQREEQRRTIGERCERVSGLINGTGESAVAWCHLNDEGDELERMIPDAKQVSGSDTDERKEELFTAFADRQLRVLITKPVLAGFGMNWQHCSHQTFFPSHSFEQYYQSVRRCWRFGQTRPVTVDIVATEGAAGVRANLQRKSEAADAMFARLVELMNDSLGISRAKKPTKKTEVPSWLSSLN